MKLSVIIKSLFLLIPILIFTGCGAKGKQFSGFEVPEKGKGMVYIYRPSSFVGGGVYYDIKNQNNNDEVIGTLRNGGYIAKQMTPGEKTLWAKTESTAQVVVNVKENDFVCVKGGVGIGFLVGRPQLNNVDKSICEVEIKDTKESFDTQASAQ